MRHYAHLRQYLPSLSTALLGAALCQSGCVTSLDLPTEQEQIRYIESRQSQVPEDILEGAARVENEAFLVNRDFNMGLALSMDLVGPAIAAGERINSNQTVAAKIAKHVDTATSLEALAEAMRECGSACTKKARLYTYSILYGSDQPRLLNVLEWKDSQNASVESWIAVSESRPLEGQGSWTQPKQMKRTIAELYRTLMQAMKSARGQTNETQSGLCRISEGRVFDGRLMLEAASDTLVVSPKDLPNLFVVCAS